MQKKKEKTVLEKKVEITSEFGIKRGKSGRKKRKRKVRVLTCIKELKDT